MQQPYHQNHADRHHADRLSARRKRQITRRGFSLVEGTVVIAIIALMAGILLTYLAGARKRARVVSEQQFLATLKIGVDQFKSQFGILPPLINDSPGFVAIPGGPFAGGPNLRVSLRGEGDPQRPNFRRVGEFLTGDVDSGDPRYSELSLPVYLLGTPNGNVDGIDGVGYTAPDANGIFTKRGKRFEPLVAIDKTPERLGVVFGAPSGESTPPFARFLDAFRRDRAGQRPIRYYRWLPTYRTASSSGVGQVGEVERWNIPAVLGDVSRVPALKNAEYAIVGAGPDQVFGDEPQAQLQVALRSTLTGQALVDLATKDNIVEFGR